MALPTWEERQELGKQPCTNERESWQCSNMKEVEGDTSMEYEHYECKVCGRRISLDYEEMK